MKRLVVGAAMALASSLAPPASHAAQPSEVKLLLIPIKQDVALTAASLRSDGAQVLASYGSSHAIAIPETGAAALLSRLGDRVEAREISDVIRTPGGRTIEWNAAPVELVDGPIGLFVVQYIAPPTNEWLLELADAGVAVVETLPEHAALVVGLPAQVSALSRRSWVQRVVPYLAEDKFKPVGSDRGQFSLHVADTSATQDEIADIRRRAGGFLTTSSYRNVLTARIATDRATAEDLVKRRIVLGVETYIQPTPSDERQALALTGATSIFGGSYLNWLANYGITPNGLTTSGIVVDIADTGIDFGCATNTSNTRAHLDLRGRIAYHTGTTGEFTDPKYRDNVAHGTLVAGIVAGNPVNGIDMDGATTSGYAAKDSDAYGQFYFGLGVAPGVRVGNTVIMNAGQIGSVSQWTTLAVTQRCNTPSDQCPAFAGPQLCRATVQNHSNNEYESTGVNAGYYTTSAREFDISVRNADRASMIPLAVTVSAGNIGQLPEDVSTSVLAPATAKNVIAVGSTETYRESIASCLTDTGQGTHPELRNLGGGYDVLAYGSRRGTADNRLKPDVLAPSTLSFGPHAQGESFYCGTGGNPAMSYFPQYHGASGTSFAAPVAAGSVALLRYRYGALSPAMYKSMLVAGARSMKGGYDRFTGSTISSWPNAQQGFGIMTLDKLFSTTPSWRDQDRVLLQSQTAYYSLTVSNPSQPVKIVLAWTDAPGAIQQPGVSVAKALKNDLDLRATLPGGTYYGNYFDSTTGYSKFPGGCGRPSCPAPADLWNNVEVINVNPALFGDPLNRSFTVKVVAPGLSDVGVPGASAGAYNQDYALFVLNGTLQNQ